MSTPRILTESLLNMVADKGLERNSHPEFSENDFDGWLMFLKAHLRKIGGADDALLEEDYPTTLTDEDGEELDHPNRAQMKELEVLQEEWKIKNRISVMELSWTSATRTPTRDESLLRDARLMLQKL